ncbi:uncharacterized protein RJT20DRAFT_11007 [Scheffersomyces xylosifermentans]|uniref:uncharacterized protein n=1 Tax=Scheffersomyces xylosifermentans TaxID=1304137 RepID=UPI00315CF3D9
MSAPQANELASPSSSSGGVATSSQPKSFHSKDFQLHDSSHKTPSPTIRSNEEAPFDSNESKTPGSKKPSPSNQKFLSTLKNFNIDTAKYKHFGHQSLMNAQSLEKTINDSKSIESVNEQEKENIVLNDTRVQTKSERNSNRLIIDSRISQILGLPESVIDEESVWPYNVETLNEILRYKVEQEKTRQESIKSEFGATAVELLKLAKSMNIHGDLIPFLFISNSSSVETLRIKIDKLRSDPVETITEISQRSKDLAPHLSSLSSLVTSIDSSNSASSNQQLISPTSTLANKRKYSDTQLPSFSETAESIKSSSNMVSPSRSPNKSPTSSSMHRRVVSDSSDVTTRESKTTTNSPPNTQLPLPPTSVQSHAPSSQQHSPSLPQQLPPNMYPVYYTPTAQPVVQAKEQPSGKSLGSPYSQKYHPVMYQASQTSQPPQPQYQPGYIAQPPQYQFFVPSPPSNPGPYMMSGPPIVRMNPQQQQQPQPQPPQQSVPSHQFQTPPESGSGRVFKSAEIHEESPYKRQKSNTKNTSINFMITTPKNPPARKYNNPHRDKT